MLGLSSKKQGQTWWMIFLQGFSLQGDVTKVQLSLENPLHPDHRVSFRNTHKSKKPHLICASLLHQLQVIISWSPHPSKMLLFKPKLRWLLMAPVPWEIKVAEHSSAAKVNGDIMHGQTLATPRAGKHSRGACKTPSHKRNLILRLARAEPCCCSSTSFYNRIPCAAAYQPFQQEHGVLQPI